MQNSFLMTKCDQRSSNNNNSFMQIQPDGRSSCAVSEIQNSENELNMGFIAEDSEIVLSESHSLTDLSIQKVQSMECGSPEFNQFDSSVGINSQFIIEPRVSKQLKRVSPSIAEQDADNDEDPGCHVRGIKKKLGLKNKLIQIPTGSKNAKGYRLRSRGPIQSSDSSTEDLQNIIDSIGVNKRDILFSKRR